MQASHSSALGGRVVLQLGDLAHAPLLRALLRTVLAAQHHVRGQGYKAAPAGGLPIHATAVGVEFQAHQFSRQAAAGDVDEMTLPGRQFDGLGRSERRSNPPRMRRILRKIAENDFSNLGDTSTLADPAVVDVLIKKSRHINRATTYSLIHPSAIVMQRHNVGPDPRQLPA